MKKCLFVLACFLITILAYSQHWYYSPAPNSRDLNSVKIIGRDTILTAGGWHIINPFQTVLTPALFKTTTSGLGLWSVVNMTDTIQRWIKSMDFTDSRNGIAVGWGGKIITTTDGGDNWGPLSSPINRDFNKIFFIDSLNMIIAGGKQSDTTQTARQTILKSVNGGQTWNVVLDQPGYWLKSIYFLSPTVGYAVGDSGVILKSVNGGNSWTPTAAAPLQRDFNSVWFSDATNGIIVGGNLSNDSIRTILKTVNGGNTWTVNKDELGGWLTDVYFIDDSLGYAVGDRATVLKTTDAGQTWMPQTIDGAAGDEHFNTVRFYGPDFGFVAGMWGAQYIYNTETPPAVFTTWVDLTDPDPTKVILHGVVNSFSQEALAQFVIADNPSFQSSLFTPMQDIKTDFFSPIQAFKSVLPNTTYYYYLTAWTIGGRVNGDILSFYTGGSEPLFRTLPPSSITGSSARVGGVVKKTFPLPANLYFEFGTTPSFGSQVQASPLTINDTLQHIVTATLNSLQSNVNYYFRLKAVTSGGNYYGDIISFNTGTPYQTFQTFAAADITDSSVTLNGFVDKFQFPVNVGFEYGPSLLMVSESGFWFVNDTLPHPVSMFQSNLQPFTKYFFRLKAKTANGIFYGKTLLFVTGNNAAYDFKTLAATEVKNNSAQLNGYVNHSGTPTGLSFEYGTTHALGNEVTSTPNSVNDTLPYNVAANITGLQNNTFYYYRLKGNENGLIFYGDEKTFYTGTSGIPNWDFQDWSQETVQIPERWSMFGDDFQQVSGHSGNYALKVYGQIIALLGYIGDKGPFGGIPFHARPDSVSVWLNYNVELGDTAFMLVALGLDTTPIAYNFNPITGNSGGVFVKLSFPVSYSSALMPDNLTVGFIPFNALAGGSSNPNNYLIIDDIATMPTASVILNGDFESWNQYSFDRLLNWNNHRYIGIDSVNVNNPPMVSKTLFAAPADYAAEIRNVELSGNFAGFFLNGEITNAQGIFNNRLPSFPVSVKHHVLNGYYKYFPVNGDSLLILINMYSGGQIIGEGVFLLGDSVTEFTPFELPIVYTNNVLMPDSGNIIISSCYSPAKGISRLIIDKLSFDGFRSILPDMPVAISVTQEEGIRVYPNPASNNIVVEINHLATDELYIQLIDLSGRKVQEIKMTDAQNKMDIDLSNIHSGVYIVRYKTEGIVLNKKIIVLK